MSIRAAVVTVTGLAAGLALSACASTSSTPATTTPPGMTRLDGTPLAGAQVDAVVTRLMGAARVTGLALAIVERGGPVYVKAYGLADAERGTPLTTRTVMYGASLTKAAFAYTVMTLVDEGRVDLDRPIAASLPRPLPEYENYRDLTGDERWRRITPRMLLAHTSGLPNWRFFNDDERLDIKFDPGTRYVYSGEGINLLQMVIEESTGLQVGDLMRERVFVRFGMTRTSMTWRDDFSDDLAMGHDETGRSLGHDRRERAHAAGSMDTTIADYARFLSGVLRGEGLSAASRAEMLRPQIAIDSVQQFPSHWVSHTDDNRGLALAYGLGWGLFTSPRFGPAYFKEGHDDGWGNYAVSFEAPRRALLLLSNSANGEGIFKYLADALLGETCLPWYWEGYIPYDHPELKAPAERERPHPPCAPPV